MSESTSTKRPAATSTHLKPSADADRGLARVVLVTGGDKGIGKEIARKLGKCAGTAVVLCAQNVDLGARAVAELEADGCGNVVCVRLELTDPASISAVAAFVKDTFGRLDVLINNAAVCFNDPTLYGACAYTPFEKQASITINTNYFGTLGITLAVLPLLRESPSPRIVTIASHAGRLSILKSKEKMKTFTSPDLQLEALALLMKDFVSDVEAGTHSQKGWPNTCYGMSKLGLIAFTRILAREEPKIMVNCVDPGYCRTDQNANQGPRPPEHGARTPAFLALLPNLPIVTGKYWMNEAEKSW